MTDQPPDSLQAWYAHVRNMHRWKRTAGFAGCAIAIGVLMWGKFQPDAPAWMVPVGVAIAGASFLVFIYVMVDRLRWVKKNPYKGPIQ